MKKFSKILSVAMAFALMFGSAKAVKADNYTPINGGETELTKYLVVDADAEIPEAEFEFTVTAGSAQEATASSVKVWEGVNPELVKVNDEAETGVVNFSAGEATTAGAADDGIANDTAKKYASKTIALDFSDVEFTEPGVYRYLITETDPVAPIHAVDSKITTVDVYVEDEDGTLVVKEYVAYEGNVGATAPANAMDLSEWLADNPEPLEADFDEDDDGEMSAEELAAFEQAHDAWEADKEAEKASLLAEVPNGAEAGEKDDKFINELSSAKLEFGKEVTGNQGSKDQYFEFTLTLENLGEGTVLLLDMSNAELETHENNATSFDVADMDEANSRDDDDEKTGQQIIADANGSATIVVYLHDGQYVTVKGLPEGATYSLVETAAAGYEQIEKISEEENGTRAYDDEVSGTIGAKEGNGELTGYKILATGEVVTPEAFAEMEPMQEDEYEAVYAPVDQDVYTGWTNNREGVIPTGIAVSVAGGMGLLALAGAGLFLTRKKREED